MTKEEKDLKKRKKKENRKAFWKDFKKFISRGNIVDMAVGVIIGGAFGAIVTAFVNILMSFCSWPLPGGLDSLITVLPPIKASQEGLSGIGQVFDIAKLEEMKQVLIGQGLSPEASLEAITNNYTQYGGLMVYSGASIINWGVFINAVISFLVIALTLFITLRTFNRLKAKRTAMEAKALEAYYVKHPEERPAPVEPGKPAPTEISLLTDIKKLLEKNKE